MSITIYFVATNAVNAGTDGQKPLEVSAKPGQSLMHAAVAANVIGIAADCGGCLTCATCHVILPPEHATAFSPPSADEHSMLDMTASPRTPTSRLSCQLLLQNEHNGLHVELPPVQY